MSTNQQKVENILEIAKQNRFYALRLIEHLLKVEPALAPKIWESGIAQYFSQQDRFEAFYYCPLIISSLLEAQPALVSEVWESGIAQYFSKKNPFCCYLIITNLLSVKSDLSTDIWRNGVVQILVENSSEHGCNALQRLLENQPSLASEIWGSGIVNTLVGDSARYGFYAIKKLLKAKPEMKSEIWSSHLAKSIAEKSNKYGVRVIHMFLGYLPDLISEIPKEFDILELFAGEKDEVDSLSFEFRKYISGIKKQGSLARENITALNIGYIMHDFKIVVFNSSPESRNSTLALENSKTGETIILSGYFNGSLEEFTDHVESKYSDPKSEDFDHYKRLCRAIKKTSENWKPKLA